MSDSFISIIDSLQQTSRNLQSVGKLETDDEFIGTFAIITKKPAK